LALIKVHGQKDLKKNYPDARVMMIEANNRHLEDLQNIDLHMIALVGSYNGETDYYVCDDKDNDHGSGIYKENTNVPFTSVKRKIYTLDRLLGNQRFDLIKMDVQGAELDIIQGSPGFINDAKYLWLELQPHNYNIGAPSAEKLLDT
jgi:FkbM family methyltransferase